MKLFKNNKLRTNRKLIGDTDNCASFVSNCERHQDMGENYKAGKVLSLNFKNDDESLSHTVEMNQVEALRLFNSIADFVKQ